MEPISKIITGNVKEANVIFVILVLLRFSNFLFSFWFKVLVPSLSVFVFLLVYSFLFQL